MRTQKYFETNDPEAWASDPATFAADLTKGRPASDVVSDLIPTAGIADDEWARVETTDGAIAPMHANNWQPTSFNTRLSDDWPTICSNVSHCKGCDRECTTHRPWGRFCNAYYRQFAYLQSNPVKRLNLPNGTGSSYGIKLSVATVNGA